jgi:hypothetical protein
MLAPAKLAVAGNQLDGADSPLALDLHDKALNRDQPAVWNGDLPGLHIIGHDRNAYGQLFDQDLGAT